MAVATGNELAQRTQEVENAIASVRMEGLEPSEAAKAIYQRYANGELTSKEMDDAMESLLNCQYGPVRLPGD